MQTLHCCYAPAGTHLSVTALMRLCSNCIARQTPALASFQVALNHLRSGDAGLKTHHALLVVNMCAQLSLVTEKNLVASVLVEA